MQNLGDFVRFPSFLFIRNQTKPNAIKYLHAALHMQIQLVHMYTMYMHIHTHICVVKQGKRRMTMNHC